MHSNNLYESSSDEENFQQPPKKVKRYRPAIIYSQPDDFRERFRFTKRQFELLLLEVGPIITPINRTNNGINATQKLLITIRFYASNNYYYDVGDSMGKTNFCAIYT
jgi:hypothetical protein